MTPTKTTPAATRRPLADAATPSPVVRRILDRSGDRRPVDVAAFNSSI